MSSAPRAWLTGLLAAALAACAPAGTAPAPPQQSHTATAAQDDANTVASDASGPVPASTAIRPTTSLEAGAEDAPVGAPASRNAGAAMTQPASATPPSVACATDADCAVKDVGSCCGYRPACVNAQAETHPEDVKARCAAEGRVGTCGFAAIASCQCVAGQCAAAGGALPAIEGPAPPQVLQ